MLITGCNHLISRHYVTTLPIWSPNNVVSSCQLMEWPPDGRRCVVNQEVKDRLTGRRLGSQTPEKRVIVGLFLFMWFKSLGRMSMAHEMLMLMFPLLLSSQSPQVHGEVWSSTDSRHTDLRCPQQEEMNLNLNSTDSDSRAVMKNNKSIS